MFITAFLLRRDLHTFTYGVGVIINYIANITLKKYLAEPRPKVRSVQFEEFGMPSSHSQFMWFCSTYMLLFSLLRLHNTNLWKVLCVLVVVGASTTMSYSRVYLEYHTLSQIVWGGVVGGMGAFLWFLLTHVSLHPPLPVGGKVEDLRVLHDQGHHQHPQHPLVRVRHHQGRGQHQEEGLG